jgi:serine/threonine protein kinase
MVPAHPAPPRTVGRYVVYGEIAAGGMATVHFGRMTGLAGFARSVAIKRLHPQFARDPDFVDMFLDEARLAARIVHPNVVPTLDVVQNDEELLLVMEYVRGASLAQIIRILRKGKGRVPPLIATGILTGVLHGLHAAHEAKDDRGRKLDIVHRDVSPQNVLVGTDGVPRVLDFGVAKAAGRLQTTRDGQLKGKLAYMAPEQIKSSTVTRRTDIYAGAVVLWEALTCERLFRGDNEGNVLAAVLGGAEQPPSAVVQGLPQAVDRVVMRGLRLEPGERYATAREMALELEAALGVASAAEIGDWVERVAAKELAERAARIDDMERVAAGADPPPAPRSASSARPPYMPEIPSAPSLPSFSNHDAPDAPTPVGRRIEEEATQAVAPSPAAFLSSSSGVSQISQVSTVAVSQPTARPPSPTSSRKRLIVPIGVGAAALTVLLVVLLARRGPHETTTVVVAPPAQAGDPTPPQPSWTEVPPASPAPTAAATSSSASTSTSTSIPTPTAKAAARPTATAAPTTHATTAANPDCTPPYTKDAKGRVHFKPQCF